MNRVLVTVFVACALLFAAEPAFACAVCFDANEESRAAFIGTTALLSFMPLGIIGGVGLWLRRRMHALDEPGSR